MARKVKKTVPAYETAAFQERYPAAKAEAQQKADATGYDFGLEYNELFKSFSVRMLPNRENRCGHELRCEVVSCSDMSKCKPGHGPR